jgi:L-glyceraldehyde 3-phosphate reductase
MTPAGAAIADVGYAPSPNRYGTMSYRRAGRSGLQLPAISLGLWRHFGGVLDRVGARDLIGYAFDRGITHFDLANNYGTPPGAAESLLGRLLAHEFRAHRDEMIISTKAGYRMWPGPHGIDGSRKYLLASLDQSLMRLGLDYVDVFYSHRYDANTPLEETMGALAQAVRSGRALYVGISSYPVAETREAHRLLREMGVACTLHQPSYSLINRWIEQDGTADTCVEFGIGIVAFSSLAQGVLSAKYSRGDWSGTRASDHNTLRGGHLDPATLGAAQQLAELAEARGMSSAQLALAWVLSRRGVTSTVIGVRDRRQLEDNLEALDHLALDRDLLAAIDAATAGAQLNLHPRAEGWL